MSSIRSQLDAGRKPSSFCKQIRLVLLGRTGSGKSSTANTILGRKVFDTKAGPSDFAQHCRRAKNGGIRRKHGEICGRTLVLLDTPGLQDTSQMPLEVQREMRRSISLLYPGPHVFLIVIQIRKFTQREKDAVRKIKLAMGSQALSFSVVVFTHGELLNEWTGMERCLLDDRTDLGELVDGCGGRFCVFNNHSSRNREQVSALLALVDRVLQGNEGGCYSIGMLQTAEDELQEEKRLTDEREELLKVKRETAMKESFEREMLMVQEQNQKEVEELKKKHEVEKEKGEKLARKREDEFRWKIEENERKEREKAFRDVLRLMEFCREEVERREALQEKLDKVTHMLEKQVEWEEEVRRAYEEKIQKDREKNEKREREMVIQQIQREQTSREMEELKRMVLLDELDSVTRRLEEQRRREEHGRTQMEELLRREREENQRVREIQMGKQSAEKRRSAALQQELKLLRTKLEQQKGGEEEQRQLEQKDRSEKGADALKEQRQGRSSEPAGTSCGRRRSTVVTVGGYVQEMSLLGLNALLQGVGRRCCVQ